MAWITQPGPSLIEAEDELQLKVEFAGYMAAGKSAREAAYTVFRHDKDERGFRYYGRALQAVAWEADPFVQEEIERLRIDLDTKPENEPSNNEIFLHIWHTAKEARSAGKYKEATDAAKTLLEARGVIKAGSTTNVNVDNRTLNIAAEIPAEMTVEEWKQIAKAKQEQRKLPNAV